MKLIFVLFTRNEYILTKTTLIQVSYLWKCIKNQNIIIFHILISIYGINLIPTSEVIYFSFYSLVLWDMIFLFYVFTWAIYLIQLARPVKTWLQFIGSLVKLQMAVMWCQDAEAKLPGKVRWLIKVNVDSSWGMFSRLVADVTVVAMREAGSG